MSGAQVAGLIEAIDESIAQNDVRVADEVNTFIDENERDVAEQIAARGYALIPTSAGDYKITVEDLSATAA